MTISTSYNVYHIWSQIHCLGVSYTLLAVRAIRYLVIVQIPGLMGYRGVDGT